MSEQLLTTEEAALLLHRHPVTLRRNLRDGVVPGVKIGGRWYVPRAYFDSLHHTDEYTPRHRQATP